MAEETGTDGKSGAHSKQIIRRLRLTEDLIASLEVHEEEIAQDLSKILHPHLEPGEQLDLRVLMRVLRRLVEDRERRLAQADHDRSLEASEDVHRRIDLRKRVAEVRTLLLDLRGAAAGSYGKKRGDTFLGMHGRLSRYPLEVLGQAKIVLKRLSDPDWPLPKPRFEHADLGREQWHALLEGPVRELARAKHAHGKDRKETQTSVIKRGLSMDEHDHDVHWVSRWVVAMYSLAGKEPWTSDLSPQSRYRQRRKRRSEASTKEQGSPEDQAEA